MVFCFCVFVFVSDGIDVKYGILFILLNYFVLWNVDDDGGRF